jgi:hypothetical protein
MYCPHLQGKKISQARNQQEAGQQTPGSYLTYNSTMKLEAMHSSEMSEMDFYGITQYQNPEACTFCSHQHENL